MPTITTREREEEIRLECLRQALIVAPEGASSKSVLTCAHDFETFVRTGKVSDTDA